VWRCDVDVPNDAIDTRAIEYQFCEAASNGSCSSGASGRKGGGTFGIGAEIGEESLSDLAAKIFSATVDLEDDGVIVAPLFRG